MPTISVESIPSSTSTRSARIDEFLERHPDLPTPFLVVDLDVVRQRYRALRQALPQADVFYAIKANPHPQIVSLLARLGSNFDVASLGEVELCLSQGIEPSRLSYGNTIKKEHDVAAAFELGVRTFAADSELELAKLLRHVHQGTVLIRLACAGAGADWPLSRKFGCSVEEAEQLLLTAAEHGLRVGVSFHVGSQQHDPGSWHEPLAAVATLGAALAARGHAMSTVNLGGGLPSTHFAPTPPIQSFGTEIDRALDRQLGTDHGLDVMIEPGRYLVGDAGSIRAEVVLLAERQSDGARRWAYLDIGLFNGLVETQEEAIRYRIDCPDASGPTVPTVLAGPTCDSLDIIYEHDPYPLPSDLRIGSPVDILSTGAYTSTYSSVWFNGFEPLRSYYLPTTIEGDRS